MAIETMRMLVTTTNSVSKLFCCLVSPQFSVGGILGDPGQIVGARESLNRREKWHKRKVKNGEKSPWVAEDVLEDN